MATQRPPVRAIRLRKGWHTMKLSRAVAEWIKDIKLKHPGTSTAAAYESDLHRLVASMKIDTILGFTTEFLRDYFLTLSAVSNVKPSTLHRKMAAVNEFAKWGLHERLWAANPMDGVSRVRRPRHLPRPFTHEEAQRLLALTSTCAAYRCRQADCRRHDLSPQHRVLRGLLFMTGLRVTPICHLKIGDVSLDPPSLRAWVKGAKVQVVQIQPALAELLHAYILAHTDLKPQAPLLAQPNGKRLHRVTIERIMARWGQAAGVPDCHPHRARHTFASTLLSEGVDIRLIKEALGHEDIASTMTYTQVTSAQLAAAVRRLPFTP